MTGKTDAHGKRIVGIGSALIDVLAQVSQDFLNDISDVKGGMTLVESAFIDDVISRLPVKPDIVPGGSACNTIIGIGRLGGNGSFVGQCGEDDFGALFEQGLLNSGVKPQLFKSKTPTGRVVSLITPDAQRSMFTYLGASAEMNPALITEQCFAGASVVMMEGYLLFNQELMMAALNGAKKAGARIALDLASFTVVEQSLDFLKENVLESIDILIANEDEAKAFTGFSDEAKALDTLAAHADIAVLKVGARGSYISHHGETVRVDPVKGNAPVDTTGAGDLWAAGFLYGLTQGYSMEKCGALASSCGYEVCQVTGASIPDDGWRRIKTRLV
ncbi:MAG: adenosine kinase [Proteobacteria bacterium]|nr:adenosine kinase [Pseudomonadota bacterium]